MHISYFSKGKTYLIRAKFNSNIINGNFVIEYNRIDIIPTTHRSQRFPQELNALITQTGMTASSSVLLLSSNGGFVLALFFVRG